MNNLLERAEHLAHVLAGMGLLASAALIPLFGIYAAVMGLMEYRRYRRRLRIKVLGRKK